MVLVLCEILSASSRFWTHVAESISYDDNHYTTGTSHIIIIIIINLILLSFSYQRYLMGFLRSLSDCKSPGIFSVFRLI